MLSVEAPALSLKTEVRVVEQPGADWDQYVLAHAHGSPFHLRAWKQCIEDTYGFRPFYIEARRGPLVAGVLPLFLVSNFLTGKVLISTPYAVYGGALADDPAAYEAIAREVRRLGQELGVQYVELRNSSADQLLGFSALSRYVTFGKTLEPTDESILEAIPRKTRRMVRKSVEAGFTSEIETADPAGFEDLYALNLRRLGTPAFPSRHFTSILEYFKNSAGIHQHRLNGQLAGAVMTFYFRDKLLPYYGASNPAFHAAAPNNFMYFDLMRWGRANGFRLFDFGRSKKAAGGSYDFKSHWGMEERELPYEVLLVKRKDLPNFSPANPAFSWPRKMWTRLPLGLTRWLGPWLIRLVP